MGFNTIEYYEGVNRSNIQNQRVRFYLYANDIQFDSDFNYTFHVKSCRLPRFSNVIEITKSGIFIFVFTV